MKYSIALASITTLISATTAQSGWQIHFFEDSCDTAGNILTCATSAPIYSCLRIGDVTSVDAHGACLWGPGVGNFQKDDVSLKSIGGLYSSDGSNCRLYTDDSCDSDSEYMAVPEGGHISACQQKTLPPAKDLYYKCGLSPESPKSDLR